MRVVFVGTGAIGVPTIKALQQSRHELIGVVSQPDKPAGRDQHIQPPPIKKAVGDSVPVFQPRRIKDESAVREIGRWQPDVIVVMAYGQILPSGVLTAPKLACINLHASLLPKWRGAAPIQAAIAAGDNETGLTVMYVDEGLDTGDILLSEPLKIAADDTGGTLHDRLAQLAPEALLKALDLIESGNPPRAQQNSSQATYAPKLNRESGRIDWTESAETIERKIRAYNPWPGAFTEIDTPSGRKKLKVFAARIIDNSGKPGQILTSDDQLIVAAGDRAVSLQDIQLEGRKRMSVVELVRGHRWITEIAAPLL